MDDIIAVLREERKAQKISQQDLADKMGVNRSYLAKLELGKNTPTISVVSKMADVLGMELRVEKKGRH